MTLPYLYLDLTLPLSDLPLGSPGDPGAPQGTPGRPQGNPLYTEFLTVQSKNKKNYKKLSRKIGTLIKDKKQKFDLQFAPTGLNEFHIEIPGIFMDFLYDPWAHFGGPVRAQGPPGAQNLTKQKKTYIYIYISLHPPFMLIPEVLAPVARKYLHTNTYTSDCNACMRSAAVSVFIVTARVREHANFVNNTKKKLGDIY